MLEQRGEEREHNDDNGGGRGTALAHRPAVRQRGLDTSNELAILDVPERKLGERLDIWDNIGNAGNLALDINDAEIVVEVERDICASVEVERRQRADNTRRDGTKVEGG